MLYFVSSALLCNYFAIPEQIISYSIGVADTDVTAINPFFSMENVRYYL